MKKWFVRLFALMATLQLALPSLLIAGGEKAADLVVVADTRVISNPAIRYISDVYNTDPLMTGVWAVVLTAAYGCLLGFGMDYIMSRTGLDLKSRKIVEH